MISLYHDMDDAAVVRGFPYWKSRVDREMHMMALHAFHYRQNPSGPKSDREFPTVALQDRLEKSFADFLTKYHVAKSDPTAENARTADDAFNLFNLNYTKVDWSFQKQADPEGPDMPWGERTVTNAFDNRYAAKSMEAYATATLYGWVGFDKYSCLLIDQKEERPETMSDDDVIEAANAYMLQHMVIWELDETRVTFADEISAAAPEEMKPLAGQVNAVAAAPRL